MEPNSNQQQTNIPTQNGSASPLSNSAPVAQQAVVYGHKGVEHNKPRIYKPVVTTRNVGILIIILGVTIGCLSLWGSRAETLSGANGISGVCTWLGLLFAAALGLGVALPISHSNSLAKSSVFLRVPLILIGFVVGFIPGFIFAFIISLPVSSRACELSGSKGC